MEVKQGGHTHIFGYNHGIFSGKSFASYMCVPAGPSVQVLRPQLSPESCAYIDDAVMQNIVRFQINCKNMDRA
jgi:hypothetical protein